MPKLIELEGKEDGYSDFKIYRSSYVLKNSIAQLSGTKRWRIIWATVNTSADPCTDFFQYACGRHDKPGAFGMTREKVNQHVANQLFSPEYEATIKARSFLLHSSTALTKAKTFTDACIETTKDSSKNQEILATKNYLLPRVKKLEGYLGSGFTYVFGGEVSRLPDKTELANALGYLSFDQGIDTLIGPMVSTNWPEPKKGYSMFLDQNSAYMGKSYYDPKAFKMIKENYVKSATQVVATFAKAQGLSINEAELKERIRGLIEFEQFIVLTYSTDAKLRRTFQRSWNPMSIKDLRKYTFLDWEAYMKQVPKVAQEVVQKSTFKVSVYEPEQYEKMARDYSTWDPTKLVNYLFMRLVLENAQYLPSYASAFELMPEEPMMLGRESLHFRFKRIDAPEDIILNCATMANRFMQYAIGRVYIDYEYPSEDKKKLIKERAGGMIQNVIHSFQGMLDSLDWMTQETKKRAYEKTMGVVQNVAFPDWIMDNQKLDHYHQSISFNPEQENYYDMWTKLIVFNIELDYKPLTAKEANRYDFKGTPATVNAWYMRGLNSITFPAGIMQPPFFHPLWPTSVNYGGLGVIAGHELIHGFDDKGVQWGPFGEMSSRSCPECTGWMDQESTTGFNAMAQCVIDEYGQFCPLDPSKFTPHCVNGTLTQGENIADNGGIHAAFRAYRTHAGLNGQDPLLPDRLFGQFNHDQLFFLSFARVWCEKRRTDDRLYRQLMMDPHSPAMYRVFGTLQNYPAFRVAYNCPAESPYAPKKHCNVWVPNFTP
ncbi:peptidase family M13 [Ancylostoma duodenale]|uniref:Peptidase family M13 n=1 Tax=Ancylostoma duodenale TaxID=51022 RepID=A0A0C2DAD2_9BILA|nr:peptidase family M13 [Ancylostoma duodenale]